MLLRPTASSAPSDNRFGWQRAINSSKVMAACQLLNFYRARCFRIAGSRHGGLPVVVDLSDPWHARLESPPQPSSTMRA